MVNPVDLVRIVGIRRSKKVNVLKRSQGVTFKSDSCVMLVPINEIILIDNRTPARGILDMFSGQGLAQDLVEGQGRRPRPSSRSCCRPRPATYP